MTQSEPTAFGKAFKRFRESTAHTQEQTAKIAGLGTSYIAKIETGHVGVSLYMAEKIAERLGIRLVYVPESGWQIESFKSVKPTEATNAQTNF